MHPHFNLLSSISTQHKNSKPTNAEIVCFFLNKLKTEKLFCLRVIYGQKGEEEAEFNATTKGFN